MKRLPMRTLFLVAVDVALLGASLVHVSSLLNRPGVPFVLDRAGEFYVVDRLLVPPYQTALAPGDTVLEIAREKVSSPYDADFLADFRRIGETLPVAYEHTGQVERSEETLVPFFRPRYAILSILIGLCTWMVAVFVLVVRPRGRPAAILHAALLSLAMSVMFMWGATPPGDTWALISRTLYFVMYMGTATHFYFFTMLFPQRVERIPWRVVLGVYGPGILIGGATLVVHLHALVTMSLESYRLFRAMNPLFHATILVYVGAGIWNFIRSYRASTSPEERKKLQWVLWGIAIGPTPFLLLETLPELFVPLSPVPEEFTLIFLLAIPFSLAVSFVRYQFLDVQVVINRTTVYTIVLALLTLLYIAILAAASSLLGRFTTAVPAVAAVIVGLGFEPLRRRVQQVVDRRFFRVRYDFREAQRRFSEEMKHQVGSMGLGAILTERIQELIPVRKVGFCLVEPGTHRFQVLAELPGRSLERHEDFLSQAELWARLDLPVVLNGRVESGVRHLEADPTRFTRWELGAVFPMASMDGEVLGVLAVGEKRSGGRFSSEDVDLLSSVALQAGLEIERIRLQSEVLLGEIETRRLEELNELKSEFVSYVSHELRTPLTSIRLYADLLTRRLRPRDVKGRDFLRVIDGEADRLDRMVTNILDAAKIEKGVKRYHFENLDLGEVVRNVLQALEYHFRKYGVSVRRTGLSPRHRYPIRGDRDSVFEAVMNLVENATKYSGGKKYVKVRLCSQAAEISCAVEDRGRGIPPEAIGRIFEKFYRAPGEDSDIAGVGLGLPLVKSIMEAHGGRVEVESRVGKGSQFRLVFKRSKDDEGAETMNPDR